MSFESIGNSQYRITLRFAVSGGPFTQTVIDQLTGHVILDPTVYPDLFIARLDNNNWVIDPDINTRGLGRIRHDFVSSTPVFQPGCSTVTAWIVQTEATVTINGTNDAAIFTWIGGRVSISNMSSADDTKTIPHCIIRRPDVPKSLIHTNNTLAIFHQLNSAPATYDITNVSYSLLPPTINAVIPTYGSSQGGQTILGSFPYDNNAIYINELLFTSVNFNHVQIGPGIENRGSRIVVSGTAAQGNYLGATSIISPDGSSISKDFTVVVDPNVNPTRISNFLNNQGNDINDVTTVLELCPNTGGVFRIRTNATCTNMSFQTIPSPSFPNNHINFSSAQVLPNGSDFEIIININPSTPPGTYTFSATNTCTNCIFRKEYTIIIRSPTNYLLSDYINVWTGQPFPNVTNHITICSSQGANMAILSTPSRYLGRLSVTSSLPSSMLFQNNFGSLGILIPPNSLPINQTYTIIVSGEASCGSPRFSRTYLATVIP